MRLLVAAALLLSGAAALPSPRSLPSPRALAQRLHARYKGAPIEALEISLADSVVPRSLVEAVARSTGVYDAAVPFPLPEAKARLARAAGALSAWYASQGYVAARVDGVSCEVRSDPATGRRRAVCALRAVEPRVADPPVRIGGLSAPNATSPARVPRTRPSTVAAALGLKKGAPFKFTAARWQALARSGLFEAGSLTAAAVDAGGDTVVLAVNGTEKRLALETAFSRRYSTASTSIEVSGTDRNLFGRALELQTAFEAVVHDSGAVSLPTATVTLGHQRFGRRGAWSARYTPSPGSVVRGVHSEGGGSVRLTPTAGDRTGKSSLSLAVDSAMLPGTYETAAAPRVPPPRAAAPAPAAAADGLFAPATGTGGIGYDGAAVEAAAAVAAAEAAEAALADAAARCKARSTTVRLESARAPTTRRGASLAGTAVCGRTGDGTWLRASGVARHAVADPTLPHAAARVGGAVTLARDPSLAVQAAVASEGHKLGVEVRGLSAATAQAGLSAPCGAAACAQLELRLPLRRLPRIALPALPPALGGVVEAAVGGGWTLAVFADAAVGALPLDGDGGGGLGLGGAAATGLSLRCGAFKSEISVDDRLSSRVTFGLVDW